MKLTTLAAAAVAALVLAGASTAEAGYKSHGKKAHRHAVKHHHTPVYKVRTQEICRDVQYRTGYDHCGKRYTYHVTVVTYRDIYSNGTSRTWTRTFA